MWCRTDKLIKLNVMKTKNEYLKENWIVIIIWNTITIFPIMTAVSNIEIPMYMRIGTIILIFLYMCGNSLESWYNDYRFDELHKLIKN